MEAGTENVVSGETLNKREVASNHWQEKVQKNVTNYESKTKVACMCVYACAYVYVNVLWRR